MKYLFFSIAALSIIPATVFMVFDRKIVRWCVLGLILPLMFFNSTSINFFSHEFYRGTSRGLEVSLVYITAASLLLTFFILRGYRKICPDWGSRLYLIYFLLCIPSVWNAQDRLIFSFELWKMVMVHLVFMAVYYYLEFSDGDIDIIFYGEMLLVGWNTVMMLLEYFVGVYRVRGIFPHPNSMAMYMVISGLLFFARYFNRKEGRWTWVWLAVFVMASIAIVLSYSRGSVLCYPLGFIITLLCSVVDGISWLKVRRLAFIIPIMLIGAALVAPRIIDRFEKAPKASGQTRKQLALAAMNMMRDKTWIGVGLNNWSIFNSEPYRYNESHNRQVFMEGNQHAMVETVFQQDFNGGIVETIYLLVGAECGVPCMLALLCWFGYYWLSSIRLLGLLRHTEYYYIPAGLFGALTAVFLQSCLEWVLKQQINFIWLVTIFAIISYLNRHYRQLILGKNEQGAADGKSGGLPSGQTETPSATVQM